jgi:chitinase
MSPAGPDSVCPSGSWRGPSGSGDGPDEPVVNVWDTPWRYIGPVLESDLIDPVEVLPTDERPQWEPETVYGKGSEVVHEGGLFEAKWWNLNESPDSDPDMPWESPWEPIEPRSR